VRSAWRDSLYLRLVLVLLISLGASFGTMYLLFQYHLERAGSDNFARIISAQIRLAEEVLESRGLSGLQQLGDYRVAARPTVVMPDSHADHTPPGFLERLRHDLSLDLRRPVAVQATVRPMRGLWVNLHPAHKPVAWLFLPAPKPHPPPENSLSLSMLVGFVVFFAGGMLLLWTLQRPLKKLSKALQTVGNHEGRQSFSKLPVGGGGIVTTLSQRYNEMVERLDQHDRERSVMLAGIAHDLRTPITRLRLLTELANIDRRNEFTRNLDTVEGIVNQFLAFARGSEGEQSEVRDLATFVEEVAAPYLDRGLVVEADFPPRSVTIRPHALHRALVNLIENAFEYAGAPVTLHVGIGSAGVRLAVIDGGSGIREDELDAAMRPFARLEKARGGQGHSGLGLVIAQKISEEHGGRLTLANRAEGGLVAEILLSLKK